MNWQIWQHGFGLDFDVDGSNNNDSSRGIRSSGSNSGSMSISSDDDDEDYDDTSLNSETYCRFLRGELRTPIPNLHVVLQSLPPLVSLCTRADDWENKMKMRELSMVLQHSHGTLKEFVGPGDSQLCGSDFEFQILLHSLSQMAALESVEWNAGGYHHEVAVNGHQPNFVAINVDDILRAITAANAPLANVSLNNCSCPSQAVLHRFFLRSTSTLRTLKTLYDWNTTTVQVLKTHLASKNCRLEELVILDCKVSTESFPTVKELLGAVLKDSNSLQTFGISPVAFGRDETDKLYIEFYCTVAGLLKTNTSLQHYINSCGTHIVQNSTLERITKAFVSALKENTNLTEIDTQSRQQCHHPALFPLYRLLELNQLGRKNILDNGHSMTRSDWVAEMAKDNSNVDWLLFLLKSNPMLCQSAPVLLNQSPSCTRKRDRNGNKINRK